MKIVKFQLVEQDLYNSPILHGTPIFHLVPLHVSAVFQHLAPLQGAVVHAHGHADRNVETLAQAETPKMGLNDLKTNMTCVTHKT